MLCERERAASWLEARYWRCRSCGESLRLGMDTSEMTYSRLSLEAHYKAHAAAAGRRKREGGTRGAKIEGQAVFEEQRNSQPAFGKCDMRALTSGTANRSSTPEPRTPTATRARTDPLPSSPVFSQPTVELVSCVLKIPSFESNRHGLFTQALATALVHAHE